MNKISGSLSYIYGTAKGFITKTLSTNQLRIIIISKKLRFEVLTAVSTEMSVFWVVAPCSLVENFTIVSEDLTASIIRTMSIMIIFLMMEAARSSETLVNFYQNAQRCNSEDSHLIFTRKFNNSLF
jgi:hypothetical protein